MWVIQSGCKISIQTVISSFPLFLDRVLIFHIFLMVKFVDHLLVVVVAIALQRHHFFPDTTAEWCTVRSRPGTYTLLRKTLQKGKLNGGMITRY